MATSEHITRFLAAKILEQGDTFVSYDQRSESASTLSKLVRSRGGVFGVPPFLPADNTKVLQRIESARKKCKIIEEKRK